MSICTLLLWVFAIYWVLIAAVSVYIALSAFKKYSKWRPLKDIPEEWTALVRDDFHEWKKGKIIIGCILFNPIKFLIMLIFQSTCIFLFLSSPTQQTMKRKEFLINNWFKLNKFIFFNFIFRVKENFVQKPIETPIIISNHVSWFDMYYLLLTNGIASFLAKEELKKYPFLGTSAKGINSVFIKRKNEEDRDQASRQIQNRIKNFQNGVQGAYPLVIFPEGTTSNGKGLLSFKHGAFQNMSPITAYALKYECDSFGLGVDEIGQLQTLIFALAQWPKLTVKKIEVKPQAGENVEQYCQRTKSLIAQAHNLKCTQGGYRSLLKLNEARKAENQKSE